MRNRALPKLRLASVGYDFPSDQVKSLSFYSKSSLLDFDVIVFSPILTAHYHTPDRYLGKPCYDDDQSFRLREALAHWKRELDDALKHGKTVFVNMCSPETVYVATGKKEFSGTGRNQKTTRIVEPVSNYDSLPLKTQPTASTGSKMGVAVEFRELLNPYWSFAEELSQFRAIPENAPGSMCIKTQTGEKPVGKVLTHEEGQGVAFLFPFIDLEGEEYQEEGDYGQFVWTDVAMRVGAQLLEQLVWLHNNARQRSAKTPRPDWAEKDAFLLQTEIALNTTIAEINASIGALAEKRDEAEAELLEQAKLRELLYETGHPLEDSLHHALKIMGFETSSYKENESEFDVIFESDEGRLLGEAEGKDNKAVNVGKLRQLQMNILEDLEREEVEEPAKGVLFGNGYRLTPPEERADQFTAKCVSASNQNGTALVSTSELFKATKYLAEHNDAEFARQCREAILNGVGVVALPNPPESTGE